MYPKHQPTTPVPASPSLPDLEREALDYWAGDKTFQASIDARDAGPNGSNEFVFYDGPPFANGLPHYGHLLTGYVKDLVPRYQTMRGRRVERRFGWDCHGLPAEVEAEKQLGITTKAQILDLGMAKFNDACRTSVLRFTKDWERYVTRQARWVDFDNDYKTLDLDYMESVMWAFKSLHEQGPDLRGLPRAGVLLALRDAAVQHRDPDGRRLPGPAGPGADRRVPARDRRERCWSWTTTPWTLPSNLALAVGPDIEYAVLERRRAGTSSERPGSVRTRRSWTASTWSAR